MVGGTVGVGDRERAHSERRRQARRPAPAPASVWPATAHPAPMKRSGLVAAREGLKRMQAEGGGRRRARGRRGEWRRSCGPRTAAVPATAAAAAGISWSGTHRSTASTVRRRALGAPAAGPPRARPSAVSACAIDASKAAAAHHGEPRRRGRRRARRRGRPCAGAGGSGGSGPSRSGSQRRDTGRRRCLAGPLPAGSGRLTQGYRSIGVFLRRPARFRAPSGLRLSRMSRPAAERREELVALYRQARACTRCPLHADADPGGVRQRQRGRRPDVRGGGAGRQRGPAGPAVRGAGGPAAGRDAPGERDDARRRVRDQRPQERARPATATPRPTRSRPAGRTCSARWS